MDSIEEQLEEFFKRYENSEFNVNPELMERICSMLSENLSSYVVLGFSDDGQLIQFWKHDEPLHHLALQKAIENYSREFLEAPKNVSIGLPMTMNMNDIDDELLDE